MSRKHKNREAHRAYLINMFKSAVREMNIKADKAAVEAAAIRFAHEGWQRGYIVLNQYPYWNADDLADSAEELANCINEHLDALRKEVAMR